MYKRMNATWLEDNKDLVKAYREAVKEKRTKKVEEIFKEIVEKAKTITPKVDQEALKDLIIWKPDKKESKEITKEHLLNKPNMTIKDKEWMQKSIDYLIEKKMDTSENLKKLDAIVYTAEFIEVGGVKRARKDITAKPNGKNIFQHNNVTYFKRSESMIKEQNDLLAKQWMEIPLDSAYEKSMRALPGEYSKTNRHEWWNILSLIADMSMDGYCSSDGTLNDKGEYGYRWSASPIKKIS